MTRNRFTTILASAALVALTALGVAAAGSASTSTTTSKVTSARSATVKVANSHLGKILVNSQGHTLYLFKKDHGTKSSCNGACAKAWPPLRTSGKPVVGSGASASKAGTSKRSDGTRQVTYNGHPVYLFSHDTKAGQTNGEGLTAFGGSWFAVSPAGNQVSRRPSKSPPPKASPAPKKNGIPQNGGGDGDSDNFGGPSDGDGGV